MPNPTLSPGETPSFEPALALAIRNRPLAELAPLGRKTRAHSKDQLHRLTEAIRTFGFVVPVLIDENGKVLAGNARMEAARRLGLAEVPTIAVSHLDEASKRAFVLAENRLAELAEWDRETLRIELEELSNLELGFDIALTGFLEVEIEAIVFEKSATPRADDVPALPAGSVSRLGDLWTLGEHRLVCGDASDPAVVRALMGGEKARAAFTDPPYNVPIVGNVTTNAVHGEFAMASGELSDAQFDAFLATVFDRLKEALVPGGLAYVCMDWRHMEHVGRARVAAGLELLNLVVWDKTKGGMGGFYRSRHELVFVLRAPGGDHLNRVQLGRHGRDRHNVWTYEGMIGAGSSKAQARAMHPTVKPTALVRDALLDCTARGDLVVDLFAGSGTTLIAAHEINRRARMAEIDPRYADTAIARWEAFAGKEARLAATGETFRETRVRRDAETKAAIRSGASGAREAVASVSGAAPGETTAAGVS